MPKVIYLHLLALDAVIQMTERFAIHTDVGLADWFDRKVITPAERWAYKTGTTVK